MLLQSETSALDDRISKSFKNRSLNIRLTRLYCRRLLKRFVWAPNVSTAPGAQHRGVPADMVAGAASSRVGSAARSRHDCGRDLRDRGRRSTTVRESAPTDGLSRAGPKRTLDRRNRPAGPDHQSGQWPASAHAGRKRMDLPPSTADRTKKLYKLEAPPKVREIAWKAQARLTSRYRALRRRGKRQRSRAPQSRVSWRLHVGRRPGGPADLNLRPTKSNSHSSRTGGGGATAGKLPASYGPAWPTPAIRQGKPQTHTRNAVANPRIRA